jgi:prevent-host-death family protein
MAKVEHKGVEEARKQLPALLEAAARGQTTIITRRGQPIAALVPLEAYDQTRKQLPLIGLEGSGRGLWGRDSRATLRALRDEWNR